MSLSKAIAFALELKQAKPDRKSGPASVLDPHRAEIEYLAGERIPYRQIAEYLLREHGITVSHATVHSFLRTKRNQSGK